MCISADQNGTRLIKMAREEIGLRPRSKVMLRHAQQDFDTISSEVFLFSPVFACRGKPLLSEYGSSVPRLAAVAFEVAWDDGKSMLTCWDRAKKKVFLKQLRNMGEGWVV